MVWLLLTICKGEDWDQNMPSDTQENSNYFYCRGTQEWRTKCCTSRLVCWPLVMFPECYFKSNLHYFTQEIGQKDVYKSVVLYGYAFSELLAKNIAYPKDCKYLVFCQIVNLNTICAFIVSIKKNSMRIITYSYHCPKGK